MSDTLRINNLFTTAIAYSTLTGSTITTRSLTLSTLTVSSINSGAPGAFSTLNVSTLNATSTITASTITTTSFVGIGTATPSSILDVRPVGTGDAPSYGISHYFPATYSATVYANQLVASLRFKWYNDLWDIAGIRGGNTSWQSLAIRYNGTEFITVGTGGLVGIGTTNPGYLLTVGAVANPTANSAGTTVIQCNGNLNIYRNRLIFSGTPTDWNHCIYNNQANLDNEGAWDGMKFNVYNGAWFRVGTAAGSVPTTALFINSTGQVGIGLTNQTYPLSVSGAIQVINTTNDVMGLFSANYGSYLHIGSWVASGASSKHVVMQLMGGNVGIGITNPSVPLQVNGSIVGSRMYSISGSLTVGTSATNVYGMNGGQSGFINIYWGNGNALYFFQWISGITSTYLTQLAYNPGYGTVTLSWGGSGGTFITATANVSQTVWYIISFNT